MKVELLRSPWGARFEEFLSGATCSLVLCSPYVGQGACERVRRHVSAQKNREFQLTVVTDLSRDNMLSGATDVAALTKLAGALPRVSVQFLPSLHAKVYIADDSQAVVTSANLTDGGLLRNFEYGALFTDPPIVRAIREDVLRYASLGSPMDKTQL
ncbi:MAG TPA: phospholipase D-like domain-containing protein, partial [Thermoleophilia bacterium]|nr:phospholipase D-like domain-containing protein [Thermoleophilia bacterium]